MTNGLQLIIGIAAGILSFAAYALYIRAIWRGTTKPSRSTWWVLTLVGLLILLSYYAEGARESIWVPLAYVVGPFLIALLSIKQGEGTSWSRIDQWCFAGAVASMLVWLGLRFALPSGSFLNEHAELVTLLINMGMDTLGLYPTLEKAWRRPKFEDTPAWTLEALSSVLNIFAAKPWIFSIYIYPIYLAVVNCLIAALLVRAKLLQTQQSENSPS